MPRRAGRRAAEHRRPSGRDGQRVRTWRASYQRKQLLAGTVGDAVAVLPRRGDGGPHRRQGCLAQGLTIPAAADGNAGSPRGVQVADAQLSRPFPARRFAQPGSH
ncbi:hypothetical protein FRAHR75_130032 [Frankia sp. Hr75.2]|nr:hypothetical protein FRAHR75_130032 [Frankia sp. Hr75.2]